MSKKIDTLVFMAIKAIESHNDDSFKPRDKTIASFLKGAKTSPFYSHYSAHPDICGSIKLTSNEVNLACKRLKNDERIEKITTAGSPYYKTISSPSFLMTCTKDEKKYIKKIGDYILTTYPHMQCVEKTHRVTYQNPSILGENGILFSHMWFTRQNEQLVFRYKKAQNDSEKSTYKNNTIIANEVQLQTIINIIDFLLG